MFVYVKYYDPESGAEGEIIFRESFFRPRMTKDTSRRLAKLRKITTEEEIVISHDFRIVLKP